MIPRRAPSRGSHLRQVSAASLGSNSSIASPPPQGASTANLRIDNSFSGGPWRQICTLWIHDESFSKDEFLFNNSAFGDSGISPGDILEVIGIDANSDLASRKLTDSGFESDGNLNSNARSKFSSPAQHRCLFIVKPMPQDVKQRSPKLELSINRSVANIFGFKNGCHVFISHIERSQCSASHIDISFRDQYLVRADMWRLVTSELVNKTVYKGQKIVFMGTIRATVKNIFIGGKKVLSGYFAPNTIPVFRSEASRYVVFIQMAREMWDFDAEGTGDILFSRVINGFLPELFKRWANIDAKHLVTIVLFTRVEYDTPLESGIKPLESLKSRNHVSTRDFYRVVVNDIASGHWTTILDELKANFRTFLRDVMIQNFSGTDNANDEGQRLSISGHPASAIKGNTLEAIHLATSYLSNENIDRDLARTGHSIVVITPGTGLFEVSYEALAATTEAVTNMGIAIDLVSLSPMPLHSVPLFKYKTPNERSHDSHSKRFRSINHLETDASIPGFSSRSPPASFKDTDLGSTGRPLSSQDNPPAHSKEWNYGIPHWLDISFWNPTTYKEGRRITKNDLNAPIPFTVNKRTKTFVPRVRLYEIQMMGIMESEQSNISIPYLSEKNFGFQRGETSFSDIFPDALTPKSGKQAQSPSSSFKAQLSDSLRPEAFLPSFTNSRMLMINSPARQQKKVANWMDEYDENVLRPTPKKYHSRKTNPRRLLESKNLVSRTERSSVRSITSPRDRESLDLERSPSAQLSPHGRDVAISPQLAAAPPPSRPKDQQPMKPAIKTQKTPRISRTISFALRGLGVGVPRAQASTGVNAEHAVGRATPAKSTSSASMSDIEGSPRPLSSTLDDTSSIASMELPPHSLTPRKSMETVDLPQPLPISQARPISIKSISRKSIEGSHDDRARTEAPLPTTVEMPMETGAHGASQGPFPMKRTGPQRPGPRFEITRSQDPPTGVSPIRTLNPWVRSINPSNTPRASLRDASWFGRWQHAYPRPPHVAVVKWKSLKTPAILPLTTEEFPTSKELTANYLETPYRVFPNDDHDTSETSRSHEEILRDMVALRLSHGFQIVIGSAVAEAFGESSLEALNVFDPKRLGQEDATVVLSKGNVIHRLSSVTGGEIEVTRFTRLSNSSNHDKGDSYTYTHAIRTILAKKYELTDVKLMTSTNEYNWNYADNYIAGHRDHLTDPARQLRFWRIRFVLIPLHLPPNARRHIQSFSEDNEEEIHLLGISQLTSLWQRNKYIPADDKRFQSHGRTQKDPNPLNILYQTQDPSDMVGAELERLLLTDPGLDNAPAQLLPESELLDRSDFGPGSLMELAQIMQGETGVRLMDRRWHFRLHYSCFIGSEFTTWLVQTFRDIDSRDEAVKFGNELMKLGLFVHVEKRHNFRDGNYFYQIATPYRASRPESKSGWFPALSGKSDYSLPPTPSGEVPRDSPSADASKSENSSETVTSRMNTPSKAKNKMTVMLSKSMKYDVDPRKRSGRPEVVDLHYDRLHNPENCFHIELSWMSATAKLIDDAVASWASTADKYGLKLVQVPIAEAAAIVKTQTFRKLYHVKLSVEPPPPPARSLSYGATNFSQQGRPDKHFYHKALLRKFDFVLDFEAASAFSPDVEVLYSWGKPDYQHTQYIHRSGCLLAQISDKGEFLFLANRLFSTKSAAGRDATHHKFEHRSGSEFHRPRTNTYTYDPMFSPRLSPLVRAAADPSSSTATNNIPSLTLNPPTSSPSSFSTASIDSANLYKTPENLKTQIEEFCNDPIRLQQFYAEEHIRSASTRIGPTTVPPSSVTHSALEASIPSLELPASVLGHHISPPAQLETQSFSRSKALGSFDFMGSPLKTAQDANSVATEDKKENDKGKGEEEREEPQTKTGGGDGNTSPT
ncbi:Dishevelled, Egl-10, and Pleckstrin domain protein [Talaromyces stipitatus ATCC 10500]|uniref:Vacuolar membrane-associated protein IML1 n=1 Tax=Talaromyces stipitatus (strain ATCC 10500 / CBS 375.48 / QM 6759 / NRRL 1006) TaxID=441959 RepID=B8M307_TALSN|nr:Dishevelled, Egl-10, and Pleckstrin domain protein [Talaromyces stipitatus ATCC 10500]EED21983.1 Dishevelled, Egl-10, and Pleckstrin domain protein [Talaromyces stipitatus ATCC 10500]